MNFIDYVTQIKEKHKPTTIQLRMNSDWVYLYCQQSPKYGIYTVTDGEQDVLDYSNRGGNLGVAEATAPIQYFVNEGDLSNYIVNRQHGDDFKTRMDKTELIALSATQKDADRCAYSTALKTAMLVAKLTGTKFEDLTTQDFSKYKNDNKLHLENMVYDYEKRVLNK